MILSYFDIFLFVDVLLDDFGWIQAESVGGKSDLIHNSRVSHFQI